MEVSKMVNHPEKSEHSDDPIIVQALGAYLRFMLQDIETQYLHHFKEMKRIEKSGVAVAQIYRQLNNQRKEDDHVDHLPYPRQSSSPSKVRPTAGGYVPSAHPAKAAATPVAPEAAYQKTDDQNGVRSAR
jgi:hypothetical protein